MVRHRGKSHFAAMVPSTKNCGKFDLRQRQDMERFVAVVTDSSSKQSLNYTNVLLCCSSSYVNKPHLNRPNMLAPLLFMTLILFYNNYPGPLFLELIHLCHSEIIYSVKTVRSKISTEKF